MRSKARRPVRRGRYRHALTREPCARPRYKCEPKRIACPAICALAGRRQSVRLMSPDRELDDPVAGMKTRRDAANDIRALPRTFEDLSSNLIIQLSTHC